MVIDCAHARATAHSPAKTAVPVSRNCELKRLRSMSIGDRTGCGLDRTLPLKDRGAAGSTTPESANQEIVVCVDLLTRVDAWTRALKAPPPKECHSGRRKA